MSIFCSLWGCSNVIEEIYGGVGEYVLYRCERCKKKTIFCAKESKTLNNDEEGLKILELMMKDKEFSRQCQIHSEFAKVEYEHPFNFKRQEKLKDQIREKYCLEPGFRQPDPIILFQKGLWRSEYMDSLKKGESKAKKKTKPKPKPKADSGEKPIKVQGGENYDNVVNVEIRITNRNDRNKSDETKDGEKFSSFIKLNKNQEVVSEELSVEAQIARLDRRMQKHVAREEYEKAAKLRDMIIKLKGDS